MLYLLHSTPVIYNMSKIYYNGIQKDAWTCFEEHVMNTSKLIVEAIHVKCTTIFDLHKIDIELPYSGPKIPKSVENIVSLKHGLRVRDVESELITYDLCKDGVFIRSEECVAVCNAVAQGMDIETVLLNMFPVTHPMRAEWVKMSGLVAQILKVNKKRKSVVALQKISEQFDKMLVSRMMLLVRSCVIARTQVWTQVVLPLTERLAQVLALHHRLGQPAPCKPRLGAIPPAHVCDENTQEHAAARTLQRVARQILVAQYWRVELRAFWCGCCGMYNVCMNSEP